MNTLSFSLVVTTLPVTIGDSEFELKEMSAASRDVYLDKVSDRMRMSPDGKMTSIKKFDGMQSDLLTLCLSHKGGALVTKSEVQSWPASVVNKLFDKAQEMNQLNQTAAVAPEKNG